MFVHSDQSLVAPEPWLQPWAMNVIWCLTDVRPDNGATLHVPASHHFARRSEFPADLEQRLVPFEAAAGSIVAMQGRIWHTSGSKSPRTKTAHCSGRLHGTTISMALQSWVLLSERDH